MNVKKELRQLRDLAITVACGAAMLFYCGHGSPRFWGDFTGMTEAEVRASLGEPFRDSRVDPGGDPHRYRLGWRVNRETGLFLEFEKGTVVSQKRVSR